MFKWFKKKPVTPTPATPPLNLKFYSMRSIMRYTAETGTSDTLGLDALAMAIDMIANASNSRFELEFDEATHLVRMERVAIRPRNENRSPMH